MAITPTCRECGQIIPADDINVAADVAYCRNCNLANRLSAMIPATREEPSAFEDEVDLANPPTGCSIVDDGIGSTIIASHRNFAGAGGLLIFTLIWNSIVSVFLSVAIAGTLHNTLGYVPAWFPSLDTKGPPMGPGMTMFLWLFLTPFICIGATTFSAVFLAMFGRTELRIERTGGTIFTGVGFVGYRRRFDPLKVTDIDEGFSGWAVNGEHKPLLVLKMRDRAQKKFGSLLAPERQNFIAAATRRALTRLAPANRHMARV